MRPAELNQRIDSAKSAILRGVGNGVARALDIIAERLKQADARQDVEWTAARERLDGAMGAVSVLWTQAAQQGSAFDARLTRRAMPEYFARIETRVDAEPGGFRCSASVEDKEAVRISEQVIQPWDMKEGLLNGLNAKIGAHGQRYNVVNFRHQTPGTVGAHGKPMPEEIFAAARSMEKWEAERAQEGGWGRLYSERAGRLVRNEESRFRTKHRGEVLTAAGITSGTGEDKSTRMPLPWQRGGVPKAMTERQAHHFGVRTGPGEWESHFYEHKTSIFEGMVRVGHRYQEHYRTFRAVSERWVDKNGEVHGSDPDSWWHNGLTRNPITDVIREKGEPIIAEAFRQGIEEDLERVMLESLSAAFGEEA